MNTYNLNFIYNDLDKKLKKMITDTSNDIELECIFGNKKYLTLQKYKSLLERLSLKSKLDKLELINESSLDIAYQYKKEKNDEDTLENINNVSNYRVSLIGLDIINKNIDENLRNRKNNVIFSYFVNMILNNKEKDKNIFIINKIKSNDNDKLINIDEYDCRIRLSQEKRIDRNTLEQLKQLDENEIHNIIFRFKNRISIILEDNEYYKLRIDLTDVKQNKKFIYLNDSISRYELELDISFKKSINNNIDEVIKSFEKNMIFLLKQIQESSVLCSTSEIEKVKSNLFKLVYNGDENNYNMKDLPYMQPVTAEIIHIVDRIPNKYSLTDKADGERHCLIILDKQVYIINNNLEVKNITPNYIKSKLDDKYNMTILDGEYVFIKKYKKYVYLAFDILFFKGEDIRTELKLELRLEKMAEVLNNVFNSEYKLNKYIDNEKNGYDIDKMVYHYKKDILRHYTVLNKKIETIKEINIVMGKYFLFPLGVGDYEIYSYSNLLWDSCTKDSLVNCPYELDGLTYTALEQIYTRSVKETKHPIYKWKPETHNSMDFYIEYERDYDTKKILDIYDNTNNNNLVNYVKNNSNEVYDDNIKNIVDQGYYRIINLHVGRMINKDEQPVLFQENMNNHKAYIYIKDGHVRDIDNNILLDKTVVEFIYKNDLEIPERFRWIPLRTRYEKTESVYRYKRKYGNNEYVANSIWNSMQNIVTINDLKLLGDPKQSEEHFRYLKTRVSSDIINQENRGNAYYQLVSNMGDNMDQFHNFIKSNIFNIYCKPKIDINGKPNRLDVLDIGIGRGGDLMRYYHARVNFCVGIDINDHGINSAGDSCTSRFNKFKKKYPGFPNMTFMVADAGSKLNLDDQLNAIGKMSELNMKNLKSIFGENSLSKTYKKYDLISAQFMLHYLLKDQTTWTNLCYNINKFLKNHGYMMITCFDGEQVHSSFDNNGHITSHYINEQNEQKVLFDIVKKYPNDIKDINNTGLAIDMFNCSFMLEGTSQTEYLVTPTFLIDNLKKSCNMRLIETDTFENIFNVYKDFFDNTCQVENVTATREYFFKAKEFYNNTDDNKNWFNFSRLNRYYIFQKYD